ncbi:MAG: NDP-sugar synthase [Myxococcota bacterium]
MRGARAMILAAGLGTRMRPLTDERAKPALPVRGRPVISLLLALLERHGCREVLINLHHRSETIRRAVEADRPDGLAIQWSDEEAPLGTGGGLRRAAEFLRESERCVVLAGDMLIDLDLPALLERHRTSGRDVTLVLRRDPREAEFGSVGLDASGRVCRIGRHPVGRPATASPAAREAACGLFTSVRFFERRALTGWPDAAVFEDLRDWLMPRAARGEIELGAELVAADASVWEPVGTPQEYLEINLAPPALPSLGGPVEAWRGDVDVLGAANDVIAARAAAIPGDALLERCVVWEDAVVPPGARLRAGVFGARGFHPVRDAAHAHQRGAA